MVYFLDGICYEYFSMFWKFILECIFLIMLKIVLNSYFKVIWLCKRDLLEFVYKWYKVLFILKIRIKFKVGYRRK